MSGAISPLTVYNFMMWTQSTLRFKVIMKVAFQLCLRTVQVMCPVWKLPVATSSVLSSLMKWRRSVTSQWIWIPNISVKTLKSVGTPSVWTLYVLSAVSSVRNWTVSGAVLLFEPSLMWAVIMYWQSAIAFINDIWFLPPLRGARISGAWSTWPLNFILFG